jgi:hypothetical protein
LLSDEVHSELEWEILDEELDRIESDLKSIVGEEVEYGGTLRRFSPPSGFDWWSSVAQDLWSQGAVFIDYGTSPYTDEDKLWDMLAARGYLPYHDEEPEYAPLIAPGQTKLFSLNPRKAISHRASHQEDAMLTNDTDWLGDAGEQAKTASTEFDPKEEAKLLVEGLSIDQLSTASGTRQIGESVLRARAAHALKDDMVQEFLAALEQNRRRAYARYTSPSSSMTSSKLAESLVDVPDEGLYW